jgi:hypothetical protein
MAHNLSLSLTRTHTHTHYLTQSISLSLTLSFFLSLTLSLFLSNTHSLYLPYTHASYITHTHSKTHTHTHTLSVFSPINRHTLYMHSYLQWKSQKTDLPLQNKLFYYVLYSTLLHNHLKLQNNELFLLILLRK